MTLRPLIAGNWKMNGTPAFGAELAAELAANFAHDNVEMAVFPSFTSLTTVEAKLKGSKVALGAQNIHAEAKGAHTGEVSAEMVKACGCKYVILGHSERREAGETDADVAAKTCAAMAEGLVPVVCIGEKAKMEAAEAQSILSAQLRESLKNIAITDADQIVVAYEPVWAIGTGLVPTTQDLEQAFDFLRKTLVKTYGEEVGGNMRILYGGSLNAQNADEILPIPHINGGLIGGASLKAESFLAIANAASKYA